MGALIRVPWFPCECSTKAASKANRKIRPEAWLGHVARHSTARALEIRPGGNWPEKNEKKTINLAKDKADFLVFLSLNVISMLNELFLSCYHHLCVASQTTDGKLQDKTCGDVTLHIPARRKIRPDGNFTWNIARGTTDPGYRVYNLNYIFNYIEFVFILALVLVHHQVMPPELVPNLANM